MNGKVYLHVVKSTGRGYIGITVREVKARLREHFKNTKVKSAFGGAVRKYGLADVETTILHEGIECMEQLKRLEISAIKEHNTHYSAGGYNLNWGGDWRDISGSNNPTFLKLAFLTPDDEIIIGTEGKNKSIQKYKIPNTLFRDKLKNKSIAEGWSYIKLKSFDELPENLMELLVEARHNFWHDCKSVDYKYDTYLTATTFISPSGEKTITGTRTEYEKFCADHSFGLSMSYRVRAESYAVIKSNPLYGWQIVRGVL